MRTTVLVLFTVVLACLCPCGSFGEPLSSELQQHARYLAIELN